MADANKIKEILRRDVRAGAQVTEQQLSEVAKRVAGRETIDESAIRELAKKIVKDESVFICASVDVGDIKNEIEKPRKRPALPKPTRRAR